MAIPEITTAGIIVYTDSNYYNIDSDAELSVLDYPHDSGLFTLGDLQYINRR